jgi:predicted oxidoreductase
MALDADAIVVGSGLAGLVAAGELAIAGRKVILVDQEPEQSLGGQAFWSLGGLFLVDSPLQRRMGIKDSYASALQDWMGAAGFDRPEDHWPRQWAKAYVGFAAGEKYSWLRGLGIRFFPVVGWAERGRNSVPRFHITWGTGPGVLAPFLFRLDEAVKRGTTILKFRHRVKELIVSGGAVTGVRGEVLAPSDVRRGQRSTDAVIGDFSLTAQVVIVTSGGIGANHDLVRANWPQRLGPPPRKMLCGVPAHVDGRMLGIARQAGANLINPDRMWHYTEGITNWNPIWENHGIRIIPGPSSLWFDARGGRLPPPLFPGFDTLATLDHLVHNGADHSWFILNQKIIRKEFALSGSEQNPDLTNKDWRMLLGRVVGRAAPGPVEAFKQHGVDFVVKDNLHDLVKGMNAMTAGAGLSFDALHDEIMARDGRVGTKGGHVGNRDGQVVNEPGNDRQIDAIRQARTYLGDKLIRTAPLHKILDPAAGPLIAVRLHILTRKTLGGLETNLSGQVLNAGGEVIPGLYAAGEVAGFGGGGMHGYRALEGSFLGGCLYSGRVAGRAFNS